MKRYTIGGEEISGRNCLDGKENEAYYQFDVITIFAVKDRHGPGTGIILFCRRQQTCTPRFIRSNVGNTALIPIGSVTQLSVKMLRSLKDSLDGNRKQSLPMGSYRAPKSQWNPFAPKNNRGVFGSSNSINGVTYLDGSASSIHTPHAMQLLWQRASGPVRTTWIMILLSVIMLFFGYRWLRYSSAGVSITCLSLSCDITIYPIGFLRPVKVSNLHRDQIAGVMPIKTQRDGTFVTDRNIVLMDPYTKKKGKKKYSYAKSSSYKGPDENGYYLTYAIILEKKEDSGNRLDNTESNILEDTVPQVDLTPLLPYLDLYDAPSSDATNVDAPSSKKYRLIPRKFGTRHNQRRVRSMIQKIEGYIKHRRQKIVINENAAPAWQGIVLLVVAATTLLITIALGQFYDEEVIKGPGIRRKEQLKKHNPSPSTTIAKRKLVVQNANQIATPMQYEVNTLAQPPAAGKPKARASTANPNMNYRRAVASAHSQSRVTR